MNGRFEHKVRDIINGIPLAMNCIAFYKNGKFHRLDGAAVEWADGFKEWYVNGVRHRKGKPACLDHDGSSYWWLNGKRHREDGPAIECAAGKRRWYLNGDELTEEEFNQWLMKKELNEKLHFTLEPKPTTKRGKI